MRVTPPVTITAIISSTLSEPGSEEQVYSPTATYGLEDRVISMATHLKYESLQAGNTAHPLPLPPEEKNDWWMEVEATNKWAMFDLSRNTQSVGNSPMTVKFAPGERIDTIGVFGMYADAVHITMRSSGAVVYSNSRVLIYRNTSRPYEYAFGAFKRLPSCVFFDLPPITNAEIEVTLTIGVGQVKCGAIIVGRNTYLGEVQVNPESDTRNFSVFERDKYGKSTLIPINTIPTTKQTLVAPGYLIESIRGVRKSLDAKVALWTALDDVENDYFEALMILGIHRRFLININKQEITISLELEEF